MRKLVFYCLAAIVVLAAGIEGWSVLQEYPVVAGVFDERAAEIRRFHGWVESELGLQPTRIRLVGFLMVTVYRGGDGSVLFSHYDDGYSSSKIYGRLAEFRRTDPKTTVDLHWAQGIHDPSISTVFLNRRDGLSLRVAGHELAHALLHPASHGSESTPADREMAEALADALGTIALANAFLGLGDADGEHLDAFGRAVREGDPSVTIMGEQLRVQCTEAWAFDLAAAVAAADVPLSRRFEAGRRLLGRY
jgi:hypothetical protein